MLIHIQLLLTQAPGGRNDILLQRHQSAAGLISAAATALITAPRSAPEFLISGNDLQKIDIRNDFLWATKVVIVGQCHVVTDEVTGLYAEIFHIEQLITHDIAGLLFRQEINCDFFGAYPAIVQCKLAESVIVTRLYFQHHLFQRHDVLVPPGAVQYQRWRLVRNRPDIVKVRLFCYLAIEIGRDDAIAAILVDDQHGAAIQTIHFKRQLDIIVKLDTGLLDWLVKRHLKSHFSAFRCHNITRLVLYVILQPGVCRIHVAQLDVLGSWQIIE